MKESKVDIEFKQVGKSFGNFIALRDINLTVAKGEKILLFRYSIKDFQ
jgi:ABC-type Fe3+/spermidine/putrescine transport system ATPase subunit